jgi:hypothetical protein
MSPRWGSTPRLTDWLTVSRNVTLTLVIFQPVLSSERALSQAQDSNCQTVTNIWSWAPDGARHQERQTERPSVAMWLWLWLIPHSSVPNEESSRQPAMNWRVIRRRDLCVIFEDWESDNSCFESRC